MLNGVAFLFLQDVLDLWYSGYFLFLIVGNAAEIDELNEWADKVEKAEDAANIIKQYKEVLHVKRKGIIVVAFYQGKIFKCFKEKEKFQQMVRKLKIHKSTIVFKINVFKLIKKYPKLMKSSVTLTFLKNYFKDIKQICKGNSIEFE